jgi:hypothetical protein
LKSLKNLLYNKAINKIENSVRNFRKKIFILEEITENLRIIGS